MRERGKGVRPPFFALGEIGEDEQLLLDLLPHLIESHYQGDMEQAIRNALAEVRGSYANAVVSSHDREGSW